MYSTLDLSLKRHTSFLKLRVAYNKVYHKMLGLGRLSSASEIFVTNNILNFEALMENLFLHLLNACQSPTIPLFAQPNLTFGNKKTVWKSSTDKLYL